MHSEIWELKAVSSFCHNLNHLLTNCILATPKAFGTSAQPGKTRSVATRVKLCEEPLVYSLDTPGVMLPYLGPGKEGVEKGLKLAAIGE